MDFKFLLYFPAYETTKSENIVLRLLFTEITIKLN